MVNMVNMVLLNLWPKETAIWKRRGCSFSRLGQNSAPFILESLYPWWVSWYAECYSYILESFSLHTADVSPRSSPLTDISQGTSTTQRQKFHTDHVNQCLHNKSSSHGVSNVNLFNFMFLLVDFCKVLGITTIFHKYWLFC